MNAGIEALEAVSPLRTRMHRRIVTLFKCGDFTSDEVATRLGLSPFTARPRCAELVKRGFLEDSGERRKNESGKRATVWKMKRDGQQFLPLTASNNKRNGNKPQTF